MVSDNTLVAIDTGDYVTPCAGIMDWFDRAADERYSLCCQCKVRKECAESEESPHFGTKEQELEATLIPQTRSSKTGDISFEVTEMLDKGMSARELVDAIGISADSLIRRLYRCGVPDVAKRFRKLRNSANKPT